MPRAHRDMRSHSLSGSQMLSNFTFIKLFFGILDVQTSKQVRYWTHKNAFCRWQCKIMLAYLAGPPQVPVASEARIIRSGRTSMIERSEVHEMNHSFLSFLGTSAGIISWTFRLNRFRRTYQWLILDSERLHANFARQSFCIDVHARLKRSWRWS